MADSEKIKGFSLRKTKASRKKETKPTQEISSPLGGKSQIASQAYLPGVTSNSKALPPQRQNAGGATSDIVKKRYSVRYNQAPDFNADNAPPVPSLPSIPQKHAKQVSVGESGPTPEQRVELRALKDPSLQAETCENIHVVFGAPVLITYRRPKCSFRFFRTGHSGLPE